MVDAGEADGVVEVVQPASGERMLDLGGVGGEACFGGPGDGAGDGVFAPVVGGECVGEAAGPSGLRWDGVFTEECVLSDYCRPEAAMRARNGTA